MLRNEPRSRAIHPETLSPEEFLSTFVVSLGLRRGTLCKELRVGFVKASETRLCGQEFV